jgi:outer membrane protein
VKTLTTSLAMLLALGAAPLRAEENVLTLDDALRLAHDSHPLLRQSAASVGVTRGAAEQARGVLLPQLGASAQYSRSRGAFARVGSTTGVPGTTGTSNLFSFGLSATQTLWDFAAIERLRAAGFNHEAELATQRATELQVALGVRRAYFAAAAQVALVRVADETLKNDLLHREQVDAQVKAGIKTAIDLAQVRTLVASAQLGVINAKNGLHLALAALTQALGSLEPRSWSVNEAQLGPIANEADELTQLVKLAIEQRPELASLRRRQESAAASVLAATGGYLPTLGANGSVSAGGTAVDALSPNWSFGASLTWNLFNGGQTTGLLHQAQAQAALLQAQLDTQLLQVRVDVEQARATIEDQRSAVEAAQVAVEAARSQLGLAEGRLKAGVGSALELGDAQVQFTTASAQLVQARLTLSTARAQLLAALGVAQ